MTRNYKILVVDDEPLARRKIARFVGDFGVEHELCEAGDGLAALALVESFKPDLVFLDIEMPELSGFEFLFQVEQRDFKVVFQTAFDQYAVRAFEEHAIDYLLKPFDRERFNKAMQRAIDSVADATRLQELEQQLGRECGYYLRSLTIKHRGDLIIVPIDEIECFLSQDHYTSVITSEREYVSNLSLDHLEVRLPPARFMRTHRKAIVRGDAFSSLSKDGIIRTQSGREAPLARRRRSEFMNWAKL